MDLLKPAMKKRRATKSIRPDRLMENARIKCRSGGQKSASAAITARNREKSPLLRLPGELRNKIYTYALSDQRIYIGPDNGTAKRKPGISKLLSLTQVCHQIRSETIDLPFFEWNTFVFRDINHFMRFFKSLPPSRRKALLDLRAPRKETRDALDRDYDNSQDIYARLKLLRQLKSRLRQISLQRWRLESRMYSKLEYYLSAMQGIRLCIGKGDVFINFHCPGVEEWVRKKRMKIDAVEGTWEEEKIDDDDDDDDDDTLYS